MKQIQSYKELKEALKASPKVYCLLYKKGSEISDCAYNSIKEGLIDNAQVFTVDVNQVRDIHTEYGITSVPTLMTFENEKFINTNKGCNSADYYKSLFSENIYTAKANNGEEKDQKRVIVYSTPSCTYCTQIKKYFGEKGIKYRDIDVSKDQNALKTMIGKSGQQGVPQTDINGQIVMGFDRIKINQLLGIE